MPSDACEPVSVSLIPAARQVALRPRLAASAAARVAVCLLEDLGQLPLPMARPHPLDPALPDLGCANRPDMVPPEPAGLAADLCALLVQRALDVPKRQRETDVEHRFHSDDLRAGLGPPERAGSGHARMRLGALPQLKTGFRDRAFPMLCATDTGNGTDCPYRVRSPVARRLYGGKARDRDCRFSLAPLSGSHCRQLGPDLTAAFRTLTIRLLQKFRITVRIPTPWLGRMQEGNLWST